MILFNACRRGLTSLIKELLLEGVDPNSVDMAGQTALHIACLYNHIDIVRELLSYGVDINIKDKMGRTPLFCACLFDHKEIVKELLASYEGADPNIVTTGNKTPLHIASLFEHKEIIKELLFHNANLNVIDDNGKTPLQQAVDKGSIGVIKLLEDYFPTLQSLCLSYIRLNKIDVSKIPLTLFFE